MYNKKYLKTLTKPYNDKINRNFYINGTPEEGCYCVFLSVILIYFDFRIGEDYYPKVFLEKCKYVVKESKMGKFVNKVLDILDKEAFDEE